MLRNIWNAVVGSLADTDLTLFQGGETIAVYPFGFDYGPPEVQEARFRNNAHMYAQYGYFSPKAPNVSQRFSQVVDG